MSALRLSGCLLLPLLALAACAGNGDGLDANGNPIGSGSSTGSSTGGTTGGSTGGTTGGSGGITASFQSIQDNVFTPICSVCHQGAGAPEGMQLSAGVSYDMIVNVASQEQPGLDRIKPGDPDDSYLVQKIEGTAATGAQMPDGCPVSQPCLDQSTIDAIRQWVSDGAPNN